MARAKLLRSGHCLHDGHDRCPHFSDVDVGSVRRPRPKPEYALTVCVCDCHARCVLNGQGSVAREVWQQQCTCPGAGPVRERQDRTDELGREVAEVLADVRREGHLAPDEIERRLRAVYLRHDESPPPGLTAWARVTAAGTARRGTRTPRLLWMGTRAVAGTVRWAWEPASSINPGNRAEARKLYRTIGVVALLGALLTATAARSSGWRRFSVGAGAALAWLATIWATSLGTAVVHVARSAEEPAA